MAHVVSSAARGHVLFKPGFDLASVDWAAWFAARLEAYADNDPMPTFNDQGAHNNDALAVGAAQPTFKTGIVNGLPVARFDGVANYMATAAFALVQPCTMFIVWRELSVATPFYRVFDGSGVNLCALYRNGASGMTMVAASNGPATLADPSLAFNLYTCVFNGALSTLAVNAGADIPGDVGAGDPGGITLAALGGVNIAFGNVDIAEFLVYNGLLPAPITAKVKAALIAIY